MTKTEIDTEEEDQGDLFFWLGEDGQLSERESMEAFLQSIAEAEENERMWREVDMEGWGGLRGGVQDDTDGGAYFSFRADEGFGGN